MDEDGALLTDELLLDRVQVMGAVVVVRAPVERVDFATWRRDLRRAARVRELRISVNQLGDRAVLVSNPDHVVTKKQMRAALEMLPRPLQPEMPPSAPVRPLRVVREPDGGDR